MIDGEQKAQPSEFMSCLMHHARVGIQMESFRYFHVHDPYGSWLPIDYLDEFLDDSYCCGHHRLHSLLLGSR